MMSPCLLYVIYLILVIVPYCHGIQCNGEDNDGVIEEDRPCSITCEETAISVFVTCPGFERSTASREKCPGKAEHHKYECTRKYHDKWQSEQQNECNTRSSRSNTVCRYSCSRDLYLGRKGGKYLCENTFMDVRVPKSINGLARATFGRHPREYGGFIKCKTHLEEGLGVRDIHFVQGYEVYCGAPLYHVKEPEPEPAVRAKATERTRAATGAIPPPPPIIPVYGIPPPPPGTPHDPPAGSGFVPLSELQQCQFNLNVYMERLVELEEERQRYADWISTSSRSSTGSSSRVSSSRSSAALTTNNEYSDYYMGLHENDLFLFLVDGLLILFIILSVVGAICIVSLCGFAIAGYYKINKRKSNHETYENIDNRSEHV